jgi:transcriptional regulator with GAF, ATPase, and Fis domain
VSSEEPQDPTATEQRSAISPAPTAAFQLVVSDGPDAGTSIGLDGSEGGPLLVGKSPVCSLRLADPRISRRHLSLEIVKNMLHVVDVGSTNGTVVGELRIVDALLQGGERICIGDTTLAVSRIAAPGPIALPALLQLGKLVGMSREMRRLYPLISKLAASDVPVLIEGETGTGKEVLAESIHAIGPRAAGPFIVFDCTAVAPNLVESELFGHERGSFTGATGTRKGVFEQADGGTLLIDEIGDLDVALQPKLLRALERGEVRRVGGGDTIKVDVRVLSATRRDLDEEVQAGRFRDDLFHRLVVTRLELPPLRMRRGDVAVLARHFARELGGPEVRLPEQVLTRWDLAKWPGNVRELRNAVARQLALGDLDYEVGDPGEVAVDDTEIAPAVGPTDTKAFVEGILGEGLPLVAARQRLLAEFDRAYLGRVLTEHKGNVTRAAAAAGIARRNFQLLRNRYKI